MDAVLAVHNCVRIVLESSYRLQGPGVVRSLVANAVTGRCRLGRSVAIIV
jgi:hypothetical protein